MKLSIIIPVYNEEKLIVRCLNSIIKQTILKKDYEIIVVNDGSTDKTLKRIKLFSEMHKEIKITIHSQENKGRAYSRDIGANLARFNIILFIDSRCYFKERNVIKKVLSKKYQPIVGSGMSESKGIFNRFNILLRKKIYGEKFHNKFEDFFIDKTNFEYVPKGTTVLLINKQLFLEMQLLDKANRYVSDDTKLLKKILENKKILKTWDLKVMYTSRDNLSEFIKHTYERGPKFLDYYAKPHTKYFFYTLFLAIITIFNALIFFINIKILMYELLIVLMGVLLFAAYISEKLGDFFIAIYILPFLIASFYLGILKGVIVKIKLNFFKQENEYK
jgi:glycosyltransferase involved in cell wall biosynthesis